MTIEELFGTIESSSEYIEYKKIGDAAKKEYELNHHIIGYTPILHTSRGKEIKEYLEQTKGDCGVYIAVDTLKYLKKGGRVTPAAAAIGTLLNIKPILQIHGGKLDAFAKVMSMKQAKSKMINAVKKEIEERFSEEAKQGKVYIGMAHSNPDLSAQEIKEFEAEVRANFPEYPFFSHDPLPLFIVCHTGPGAIAVGYCVDKMGVIKAQILPAVVMIIFQIIYMPYLHQCHRLLNY